MNRLELRDIHTSYINKKIKTEVLKGISFNVIDGEFIVILGASGSGKTTLLKTIAGLIDYDEGEMIINSIDAKGLSIQNRNMSYVFQSFTTYNFLSVYNNIALPLKAQKIGVKEIEKRVLDIAKKLDIDYLLTRRPKELSGGQKQKIALARAFIKNPDIYLFDEPFANLDSKTKIGLKMDLKRIQKEYNATTIFVTHDINDCLQLASRVLVIDEGKIIFDGNTTELINCTNPIVESLIKANPNEV